MQTVIKDKNSNICFILYGSRFNINMKSFGPKQFYRNYYQHSLLSIQIQSILDSYPSAEIILVIGQEADKIIRVKDNRLRIIENQLHQNSNECEDIRLALNNTSYDRIVLINSDLYFNKYAIQNLISPCLICDSRNQLNKYELGVNIQNDYVVSIDFQKEIKWCNIVYLENDSLRRFKNLCNRNNYKLFLFEILNQVIFQDVKFLYLDQPNMRVFKVDTPDNYRKFQTNPIYK